MYMIGLFAKKLGMTRIFNDSGEVTPVSVLRLYENKVTNIKKSDDKYLVTISGSNKRKIPKAQKTILKNIKIDSNLCWSKQFTTKNEYKLADDVTINIFNIDDFIKIIGTGKGKGFQGTIKRHGFSRGPMSHGSHHHRKPGSIGSTYPQRVVKGKKMAGHMGNVRSTIKNMRIVDIIKEENILIVKGSVPGSNNQKLLIETND